MKRINLLVAGLFLVFSIALIFFYRPLGQLFPAQQVELSHGVNYGAVVKGYLFVQEVTLKKQYLSRVDIYMAKLPSSYTNNNVFVLLDEQYRILFTKRFSSADFGEALYFRFDLNQDLRIGAGKKVYACIYSIDGDQGSYIGLARKEADSLGKLYVVSVVNDDIVASIQQKQGLVEFTGGIGIRTYESESAWFSGFRIWFLLLALLMTAAIFFYHRLSPVMATLKPAPAFLIISGIFGMMMLILTPPFQVPDEPAHFYRSYQVASLNFFKVKDDFPASLREFSAIGDRMQFSTHEKTTRKEILSLAGITGNPAERTWKETPNYTVPYIPQAIGIMIGKAAGLSLLWQFYLGRFFNLAVSLMLIFVAIRITPVYRWVFFLLGVMPMTLYQVASFSYDAVTIGLSFLVLAMILREALGTSGRISKRSLITVFCVSILLAASKQPYYLVAFSFLIIPVSRFSSRKAFLMISAALLLSMVVVSQLWAPARSLLVSSPSGKVSQTEQLTLAVTPGEEMHHMPSGIVPLPAMPHSDDSFSFPRNMSGYNNTPFGTGMQPQPGDENAGSPPPPPNPINPAAQKKFVLSDPFGYISILLNTLKASGKLYVTSFVGLFGWIDAPLPEWMAWIFLFTLAGMALLNGTPPIRIGLLQKGFMLSLFFLGFIMIETALYVYCNPVGCDPITAVQGRYFIAIAPLLLLMCYNPDFSKVMAGKSAGREKQARKNKAAATAMTGGIPALFNRFSGIASPVAILVSLLTLLTSLWVILERFYVITV